MIPAHGTTLQAEGPLGDVTNEDKPQGASYPPAWPWDELLGLQK